MLSKIKNNKFTPYAIIILLGVIICIPLFTMDLTNNNEYIIHMIRPISVKQIISNGVFPPLISYKHMQGFGYGINIFYGVFTTYIPILISYLTNSMSLSIKIFTLLSVIFSGIYMYIFVQNVTKKRLISLISSLIYMLAPYKLTNIYDRAAVGEYVAFIFIPIIFNGLYYLINNEKKGNYYVIIGASLLILTHTITTIYTVLFCALFLLFNIKRILNKTFWKNIIMDIIMILLLTAFYTIPLIEHKFSGEYSIYDAKSMRTTGEDVYDNTNSLNEWFDLSLTHKEMTFSFGLVIILLTAITPICYKRVNAKYKKIYNICGIISLICLVMCSKLFPWNIMPQFLTVIQFAWRLNGFFIFFISVVCGINAFILTEDLIKKKDLGKAILILSIIIVSSLNVSNLISKTTGKDDAFEKDLLCKDKIDVYNVNREYMPLKAYKNREWIRNRENRTYIQSGEATISNENKNKLYDKIEIETQSEAELELPYLYYLGYTTLLNGNKIDNYESDNGMVCVKISSSGSLEIKYEGTMIEKAGYIISTMGVLILVIYICFSSKINI